MGYQFIHVECYARTGSKQRKKDKHGHVKETRKWSIHDIAAEAERDPGACHHVMEPMPPSVLYGCSAREAAKQAEGWATDAKDSQGRALRTDGLCLLAGVASMPAERIHEWEAFKTDAVKYLKHKYGKRLKSVIEHIDEEHPHMHFYVVPEPGERFDLIHDGRKAAEQLKTSPKGQQNRAYKEAMRAFQDDFSEKVASLHGLARIGPARRRLTRSEWKSEQDQAQIYARSKEFWRKETEAVTDTRLLAYLTPEEVQVLRERRARIKAPVELELREPVAPPLDKPLSYAERLVKEDPLLRALTLLDASWVKKKSDDEPDLSR